MYRAEEMVVYGQNGVCRVVEVCHSPFDRNDERLFYVLRPEINTDKSTIFVPVETAEDKMRLPMTKAEAEALLASIPEIGPLTVEIEKARRDTYRRALVGAMPRDYVAILKAVVIRRKEALLAKRQLAGADAEYEQKARTFLALELAMALGENAREMAARLSEEISGVAASV